MDYPICPNCESIDIDILSVLRYGNRCRCKDCEEYFVVYHEGVNYVGNEEFNTWYNENRIDLYNISEKLVSEIGETLDQKDWSEEYKIVATNIILKNINSLCAKLGIQDMEEEISSRLRYKEL